MKYKKTGVVCAILLLAACIAAGAVDIQASIDALLADPALKHGVQGVVVESLATGRVLYERNREKAFVPASNFKLIVCATALDRLGPGYTFKTEVVSSGTVDEIGVLHGDLILIGGGDPILSTDDLRVLADQVKGKGIRRIAGSIIADDTRFDREPLGSGWAWDDEPYYYSPEISALNLDENTVAVYVHPGEKTGSRANVTLRPATRYLRIENTATTGAPGSANTIYVDRKHGENLIRVSGSVPLDYKPTKPTDPITVETPALYAATVFRDVLRESRIRVDGGAALGTKRDGSVVVAAHRSPPLTKILPLLMKPSDNLIAEVLLKTLGAELKGKGTAEAGAEVELEFLKEAGADVDAISIVDGSGLSRRDYVSPGNLVSLLRHMWRHRYSQTYVSSLPVAGVDGTLRRRMKGTAAEGNVRAKTGYVSRVSSLSGYVTTRSGEPLVFSMLMNGHLCPTSDARRVQDSICELLASLP